MARHWGVSSPADSSLSSHSCSSRNLNCENALPDEQKDKGCHIPHSGSVSQAGAHRQLFNSYCASMYTPHLWWNYKKMSICKLQITYHNILKMNIGLSKYESTSATCATTNTQCCQSVIRNLVYKFVCRLDKSNNTIVKALLSSSIVYSSRIRSHWRGLLYVHGVYE